MPGETPAGHHVFLCDERKKIVRSTCLPGPRHLVNLRHVVLFPYLYFVFFGPRFCVPANDTPLIHSLPNSRMRHHASPPTVLPIQVPLRPGYRTV